MLSPRHRLTIAVCGAILLALATAVAASAAPGQQQSNVRWAWVTVREPALSYDPPAKDQGNSTASTNHVTYFPTGEYTVGFEHIGGSGGMVHVTPLGATTNVCEIIEWGVTGPDLLVDIACFTRAGTPAATRFTASYLATDASTGKLAYLWANEESATDYVPKSSYQYNSTTAVNTIHRVSTGLYLVTLPDLGSMRGHVQVTAYETGLGASAGPATEVLPSVCTVGGWEASGSDMVVSVYCRDSMGNMTDSRFDLTFMQGVGLKGVGGDRVAYLWADRPQDSSYTPDSHYAYSSAGQSPTVTRQGTGRYTATLPGMPKGGAAHVTGYGSAAKRCVVGGIRTSDAPQRVKVRCYDAAGDPTNAKFTLAYVR